MSGSGRPRQKAQAADALYVCVNGSTPSASDYSAPGSSVQEVHPLAALSIGFPIGYGVSGLVPRSCTLRQLIPPLLLGAFHSRHRPSVKSGVERDGAAETLRLPGAGNPFNDFFCVELHKSPMRSGRRRRSLFCVIASTPE
jgi:hypothetical protein